MHAWIRRPCSMNEGKADLSLSGLTSTSLVSEMSPFRLGNLWGRNQIDVFYACT